MQLLTKNNLTQTVCMPETVYTYDFFSSMLCMIWTIKWEPFSVDWLRGQNFKTLWVQVQWWNGNQTCIGCNFLYLLIIFFLLKSLDFLWNYFVTQNVMINIFLSTHPPKTSDWRFAWQNGSWRRSLTYQDLKKQTGL